MLLPSESITITALRSKTSSRSSDRTKLSNFSELPVNAVTRYSILSPKSASLSSTVGVLVIFKRSSFEAGFALSSFSMALTILSVFSLSALSCSFCTVSACLSVTTCSALELEKTELHCLGSLIIPFLVVGCSVFGVTFGVLDGKSSPLYNI